MAEYLRLGVNIDHVATLRNARGGAHPCPVQAAQIAKEAGAEGITVHLREDRRHIRDADVFAIKERVDLPLNLEMAATDEMLEIALKVQPNAVCIVPEKREELTTEGGLNVVDQQEKLAAMITKIKKQGIRVSLFIDADTQQLNAAHACGADIIELHTGTYCDSEHNEQKEELEKMIAAAKLAEELGLECHAGHGLTYDNVQPIANIPQVIELNIGHFLMGEALFAGLAESIKKMRQLMDDAR